MRSLTAAVAVLVAVFAATGPVLAADSFGARLRGFEETPAAISTTGQGFFFATLNDAETELTYSLFYFGLESPVTQSHIHFGQPGVTGGIVVFLCANPPAGPAAPVPTPPACPNGPGTNSVTGVLNSLNVTNLAAAQGITAGEFESLVHAMKGQVTYVNVHTQTFPPGEIRGRLTH